MPSDDKEITFGEQYDIAFNTKAIVKEWKQKFIEGRGRPSAGGDTGGDIEHHGRVDISKDMTRHDDERLRTLIENHHKYTGSSVAQEILDNWEYFRPKFLKVMPTEYRRALEEIEIQQKAAVVAAE